MQVARAGWRLAVAARPRVASADGRAGGACPPPCLGQLAARDWGRPLADAVAAAEACLPDVGVGFGDLPAGLLGPLQALPRGLDQLTGLALRLAPLLDGVAGDVLGEGLLGAHELRLRRLLERIAPDLEPGEREAECGVQPGQIQPAA